MSLVSARLSLIHRTTVQRDTDSFTDDWGTPGTPEWDDHLVDLACRFWTTAGREQFDQSTSIVVEDMRLLVPLGTDISERDRLGDITERGDTIAAGPIGIRAVIHRKDHLELMLVRLA